MQSKIFNALPSNPTFNQFNNPYEKASYDRICDEFGIESLSDLHFKCGMNHSLGNLCLYISMTQKRLERQNGPVFPRSYILSAPQKWTTSSQTKIASNQYDWCTPKTAAGLTKAGLSQINQSIEVCVYCILGAHINVSITFLEKEGKPCE